MECELKEICGSEETLAGGEEGDLTPTILRWGWNSWRSGVRKRKTNTYTHYIIIFHPSFIPYYHRRV